MVKGHPPLSLAALLLALAACATTPAAPPRPVPSGLERVVKLQAQGEFLEAWILLQTMFREEPGGTDAIALLRRLEAAAGIAGLTDRPGTRDRLILFEVLGHIASSRALLDQGRPSDARTHAELALSEIEKYRLRARFPRALLAELEELHRKAGP
jgi:hypothetical protein